MGIKKYAQLPRDVQNAITTNEGLILSDFDPENPGSAETIRGSILYATTGGVNLSCIANFRDAGRDIRNCPKHLKELLEIESWECRISGTALTVTERSAPLHFGAVDAETRGTDGSMMILKPRMEVKPSDFRTLWYVCAYGTEGGFIAVRMENALNEAGFSMKAENGKKGRFSFSYVGYLSMETPNAVPFTFFLKRNGKTAVEKIDFDEE